MEPKTSIISGKPPEATEVKKAVFELDLSPQVTYILICTAGKIFTMCMEKDVQRAMLKEQSAYLNDPGILFPYRMATGHF